MAKAGEGLCSICGRYLKATLGDGGLQVYCPTCLTGKPTAKPSKHRNVPTVVDGIRFASKREANRYSELKLMERQGDIRDLKLQVRFPIVIAGTYVADFTYTEGGCQVVEDCKGMRTEVYNRKKRLMKKQHGIEIKET